MQICQVCGLMNGCLNQPSTWHRQSSADGSTGRSWPWEAMWLPLIFFQFLWLFLIFHVLCAVLLCAFFFYSFLPNHAPESRQFGVGLREEFPLHKQSGQKACNWWHLEPLLDLARTGLDFRPSLASSVGRPWRGGPGWPSWPGWRAWRGWRGWR